VPATLRLSQVIFGVRDLDAAADRLRALGFDVLDGGVHPGVGTANRVVPLGDEYVELLGVVDPDLAAASDYGRSLMRAVESGDRLVRWSLRTDDIEAVAARLGLVVEARRRTRPDGVLLTWRAAGLSLALADASTPFFMQWDDPAQYPGLMPARHPNGARRVAWLEVAPADADRLARWSAGATAPLRVVGDAASPGLLRVAVETDDGEVVLSPSAT